ncbi:MAG: transglycosylase SLT domain-containing protein [Saprospiraceae bacterium]|nr:transglycosylase SLT domain-containing protein [Saprospiraceae bacterium]
MSRENYIARPTHCNVLSLLLVAVCVLSSISSFASERMEKSIAEAIVSIDSDNDKKVMDRYISDFHRHPEVAQSLIERAHLYFPTIEKELLRKGMPLSLKVLPLIESSFRPAVSSRVGARGLWQFMPGTARQMGLRINRYLDERCDPEKSTSAALAYLQFLYEEYGDWSMVLAAYNCGPGRVNRAIRASGGKTSFEEVRRFLPQETEEYLPKVAAAQYLFDNLHQHGYSPVAYDRDLQLTTVVTIYEKITLEEVAEAIGMSLESIEILNPAIRRDYIPNSESGYPLRIPRRHEPALSHYIATGETTESPLKTYLETYELWDDVDVFELSEELEVNPFDLMIWNDMNSRTELFKRGQIVRYYQIQDPAKRVIKLPEIRTKSDLVSLLPPRLDYMQILLSEILRQEQIEEEELAFQLHSN